MSQKYPTSLDDKMQAKIFVQSWSDLENDTGIAKLFRIIVARPNQKIGKTELREIIEEKYKLSKTFISTMVSENHQSRWATVFEKDDRYIRISKEAKEVIKKYGIRTSPFASKEDKPGSYFKRSNKKSTKVYKKKSSSEMLTDAMDKLKISQNSSDKNSSEMFIEAMDKLKISKNSSDKSSSEMFPKTMGNPKRNYNKKTPDDVFERLAKTMNRLNIKDKPQYKKNLQNGSFGKNSKEGNDANLDNHQDLHELQKIMQQANKDYMQKIKQEANNNTKPKEASKIRKSSFDRIVDGAFDLGDKKRKYTSSNKSSKSSMKTSTKDKLVNDIERQIAKMKIREKRMNVDKTPNKKFRYTGKKVSKGSTDRLVKEAFGLIGVKTS